MSAMSRLLSSCINMCVLPLMPMSGSTRSSALPPAALAAATKARRPARKLVDVIAEQHENWQVRVGRHVVGGRGAGARFDRNNAGDAFPAQYSGLERVNSG